MSDGMSEQQVKMVVQTMVDAQARMISAPVGTAARLAKELAKDAKKLGLERVGYAYRMLAYSLLGAVEAMTLAAGEVKDEAVARAHPDRTGDGIRAMYGRFRALGQTNAADPASLMQAQQTLAMAANDFRRLGSAALDPEAVSSVMAAYEAHAASMESAAVTAQALIDATSAGAAAARERRAPEAN